jgi:hypothetical protein
MVEHHKLKISDQSEICRLNKSSSQIKTILEVADNFLLIAVVRL